MNVPGEPDHKFVFNRGPNKVHAWVIHGGPPQPDDDTHCWVRLCSDPRSDEPLPNGDIIRMEKAFVNACIGEAQK